MDPEALRDATERWVDAEIIDEATADQIRAHETDREYEPEQEHPSDGDESPTTVLDQDRLVVALSVMGAVLVGAGILLYLAANWDRLSTAARTAVLAGTPLFTAIVGLALARDRVPRVGHAPRVGHGCWFLAAAFLGPALFLLADLHALDVDASWLLLAWGLGVLPAGHAFESRPTAALGLAVLVGAIVDVATVATRPFAVAFVGAVVVAAALLVRDRSERLAGVYRLVGLAVATLALLLVAAQDGRYGWIEVTAEPTLVASGLVAVAVAVAVSVAASDVVDVPGQATDGDQRAAAMRLDALAVAAPVAVTTAVVAVVRATPPFPELAAFLLVHALVLGLFVAIVVVAAGSGSRALVNLVAVGFLVQVLLILHSTVAEVLSGAVALIAAGLLLLGVGLALERGRRRLLARIQ
ncbi:DUF2157 domain-containing protein [Haloparvum sp. AD34]